MPELDFATTLAVLMAALALIGLAQWRGSRPAQLGRIRWIPWRGITIASGLVVVLMVVHLASLGGVTTGDPRYRY
jgi:hypothetical protein